VHKQSKDYKMAKNAIVITWSGFQDHELVYPYYRLLGAGFNVTIVGDKKDDLGRFYGIFGLNMPCHQLITEFVKNTKHWLEEADLLVIPGGVKSLEKLRLQKEVLNFISDWHKRGKIISSTCHGAQMLISAKIVKGETIAGYYSLQDDIENAGAVYSRQPVVVSRNIISSPHYDFMGEWMEITIKEFNSKHE
jgi:protease I